MSLKYAIIGTGAIGGYYGGMLARAGKDVHFLFHSDYDYVRKHGLRVDSIKGDFVLDNVQAYNATTAMPVCDVILVCLKSTKNAILEKLLPPLLHKNTLTFTIVLLQVMNGLRLTCTNNMQRHIKEVLLCFTTIQY